MAAGLNYIYEKKEKEKEKEKELLGNFMTVMSFDKASCANIREVDFRGR